MQQDKEAQAAERADTGPGGHQKPKADAAEEGRVPPLQRRFLSTLQLAARNSAWH